MARSASSAESGRVPSEWPSAVEPARQAPVTLIIGDSDTGKTTLVTVLANALRASGTSVGVLDADVGQSEIGPPTTIGLGRVVQPLARLRDAELLALHFVGVTSPVGNLLGTLVGTHRLLGRARTLGCERIVVDTSGLVRGEIGRTLKQAKIDLLEPDLLIAIERAEECEPILRPYLARAHPRVLRLSAMAAVRRRSADERRRHRLRRLQECLAGGQSVRLDLRRVSLRQPPLFLGRPLEGERLAAASAAVGGRLLWAEQRPDAAVVVSEHALGAAEARLVARSLGAGPLIHYAWEDFELALAGLDDVHGATLGLGVVRGIDFEASALTIDTNVDPGVVAAVTVGREKYAEVEPGRR